ncbi:hypothetical protein BJ085DRAFT_14076, partial [Dimargaris cristalligena]
MRPPPSVEVVLFDSPLTLRGTATEAAGSVLRGQLVVRLFDDVTELKAITLHLKGREQVFWSEGFGKHQTLVRQKKNLIDHTWSFLNPSPSPAVTAATLTKLGPGEHVFDFDVVIPGSLPETTHTEHGHVTYKLRAEVAYPGFRKNLTHELVLPVKRQPLGSSVEWMQSLIIDDAWDRFIAYTIMAPSKIYADNSTITLDMNFTPRGKGVRVLAVSGLLKEYIRFNNYLRNNADQSQQTSNSAPPAVRRLTQVITRVDQTPPNSQKPLTDAGLSLSLALSVPQAYKHIQYDAVTNFMEIQHKIKVLIKLQDHQRKIHHIYIAAPVVIM